jgi:hypothetical protein
MSIEKLKKTSDLGHSFFCLRLKKSYAASTNARNSLADSAGEGAP